MPTLHQFLMLAVMSAVIILLRATPFLIFGRHNKPIPPLFHYLGSVMTAAAIAMLVAYSLLTLNNFADTQYFGKLLRALPAATVTVALQWFLRNPMLSICAGTACYMILLHF